MVQVICTISIDVTLLGIEMSETHEITTVFMNIVYLLAKINN